MIGRPQLRSSLLRQNNLTVKILVALNPKQELAQRALDDPTIHTVGFGGAKKGGKALSLDTPIPTPTGWTTMGALKVGDVVFDERGKPCNVVATIGPFWPKAVY